MKKLETEARIHPTVSSDNTVWHASRHNSVEWTCQFTLSLRKLGIDCLKEQNKAQRDGDLSLTPGAHIKVVGEKGLYKVVLWPPHACHSTHMHLPSHTMTMMMMILQLITPMKKHTREGEWKRRIKQVELQIQGVFYNRKNKTKSETWSKSSRTGRKVVRNPDGGQEGQ